MEESRSLDRLAAVLWIASTLMALYVCYDVVRDAPEVVALRTKLAQRFTAWKEARRQEIAERKAVSFMFWQARDALREEADNADS